MAAHTVDDRSGSQALAQVDPRTLDLLEQRGITVHIAETTEAVGVYNALAADGVTVAGLFHSTC
ncbi:MTH938/NDUFAF3 family protein [Phytohabitans sp. LJ34]|uniref:MTH938/NDUFAF3 family protein n=1 Tax=Phytohabitans sp. LJ34 TaxID=3452217 RepID=UPI003F89B921